MTSEPEITNRMLLDHLKTLGQSLRAEVREVRTELQGVERRMADRIDRLEQNLTGQIGAIDERLDELEVEYLPRRVTALERKVAP